LGILKKITGATLFNEELGDDLDAMQPEDLGEIDYVETDERNTVITLDTDVESIGERIDQITKQIADEKDGFVKKMLEQRLSMLSGSVGIIRVGANSKVELKEKKDRIEDAIYATKAALKEGIVPGGGVALLNASQKISTDDVGEQVLLKAIRTPFDTILANAGVFIDKDSEDHEGYGRDAITNKRIDMVKFGIIDPVLVTKSALKNAVSVASTILSADCIISNMRTNESS
jgi:chaperonin GroEL